MNAFLNSLCDKLIVLEQKMQALPGDLDSIVVRFDPVKWADLLHHINQNLDRQLNELIMPQGIGVNVLPMVVTWQPLGIRPITDEDRSRWRAEKKPEIRVIIGKGKVEVTAASKIADRTETTLSQQGYVVLSWEHYQKLLDEIGKLISRDG